jgi:hypothetical protein
VIPQLAAQLGAVVGTDGWRASGVLLADSSKKASGIGLVVILALIGGSIFLFRSLTKQLKKLPPTFDPGNEQRLPEPADPRDDALAAARGEVPLARAPGDPPEPGEAPGDERRP